MTTTASPLCKPHNNVCMNLAHEMQLFYCNLPSQRLGHGTTDLGAETKEGPGAEPERRSIPHLTGIGSTTTPYVLYVLVQQLLISYSIPTNSNTGNPALSIQQ